MECRQTQKNKGLHMSYYFISDDRFFLLALQDLPFNPKGDISFLHTSDMSQSVNILYGDVIILNIHNINERHRIMSIPAMNFCRIIMLIENVRHNIQIEDFCGKFPWILPAKITFKDLIFFLSLAKQFPVTYKTITARERQLFHYLENEYPLPHLVSVMGLTTKSLYALRRGGIVKFGLQECNSTAVLIFRDIAKINAKTTHSNSGVTHPDRLVVPSKRTKIMLSKTGK